MTKRFLVPMLLVGALAMAAAGPVAGPAMAQGVPAPGGPVPAAAPPALPAPPVAAQPMMAHPMMAQQQPPPAMAIQQPPMMAMQQMPGMVSPYAVPDQMYMMFRPLAARAVWAHELMTYEERFDFWQKMREARTPGERLDRWAAKFAELERRAGERGLMLRDQVPMVMGHEETFEGRFGALPDGRRWGGGEPGGMAQGGMAQGGMAQGGMTGMYGMGHMQPGPMHQGMGRPQPFIGR
jgi:hypothetical protein